MTSQPSEPMTQEEAIARLKSFSFGHLQEACEIAIAALRREGEAKELIRSFVDCPPKDEFGDCELCNSLVGRSHQEDCTLELAKKWIAKADQPPGA